VVQGEILKLLFIQERGRKVVYIRRERAESRRRFEGRGRGCRDGKLEV
jgi:hypothetical protein